MWTEEDMKAHTRKELDKSYYTSPGTIVGKSVYVGNTPMYDRYDKTYAFVTKYRQIYLQQLKDSGIEIETN